MLLIKIAFVPVSSKLDAREPGGRPPHLLTDGIQRDVRTAFNDEFIVDVADDLTAAEGFHGVGQDIPTYGLHDVLDKFWTVRFDPGPVLGGIDPHVSD